MGQTDREGSTVQHAQTHALAHTQTHALTHTQTHFCKRNFGRQKRFPLGEGCIGTYLLEVGKVYLKSAPDTSTLKSSLVRYW